MSDNELGLLLLNLLNLKVHDVESILTSNNDHPQISVTLSKPSSRICPLCGCTRMLSQGFYRKEVKLSSDAYRGIHVFVRVPRMWCPDCGHTCSDTKHMNPRGHSLSYDIVIRIMDLLKNPEITFSRCAELTGVSESTVVRVFDKHCHISRATFPDILCIDEVYTKLTDFKDGGHYSKYSCIFYDFYERQIVDILPSRHKGHLHHYFQSIPVPELMGVKAVVIDMYGPYRDIAKLYFKRAVICVDSFHVIKHLNDSLSKLRIRLMNSYDTASQEYYLLKKWNYLLFDRTLNLDNPPRFNRRLDRKLNYRQLRELLLDVDPVLRKAWHLKEIYTQFNASSDIDHAQESLTVILNEFAKEDIPEYRQFFSMILNWRTEIINSFMIYKGRRVNNGVAESINSKVSRLLFNTRGMRNNQRRRKRIMYAVNQSGFSLR